MLDVNAPPAFSVCSGEVHHRKTATTDSVTSTKTSSNGNGVGDEHDSTSFTRQNLVSTLNFSILDTDVIEIEDDADDDVTDFKTELQLFPACASSSAAETVESMSKYWLNLSVPEVFGGVEKGFCMTQFPAQQQPQVRKSRRGPRSRSSQYRGVTFYRRTGRWESHIWYP